MSKNKSDVPWKRFERLVYRIETALAATGSIVTFDDHVKDWKSGSNRQVDASIRYRLSGIEMLITVECRKRGDKQDVTWIEQLAKKRENIRAHATIAIASRGFFTPAILAAEWDGIYPRVLEDIEDPQDLSWLSTSYLTLNIHRYRLTNLTIDLFGDVEFDSASSDEPSSYLHLNRMPIIFDKTTGRRFSIREPLDQARPWVAKAQVGDPLLQVEVEGEYVAIFESKRIYLETKRGVGRIRSIGYNYAVKTEVQKILVTNAFRYLTGLGHSIAEGIEFDISTAIPGSTLSMIRHSESGGMKVSLSSKIPKSAASGKARNKFRSKS